MSPNILLWPHRGKMGGMTTDYGLMRSNGYRLYLSYTGIMPKLECGIRNINLRQDAEGGRW